MALTGNLGLTQSATNNIIWVDGEAQAKGYPINFGASVCFLDRNADLMYIKSVDQSGVMTAFRKFELKEVVALPPGDYVTKQDYEILQSELKEVKALLDAKLNEQYDKNNYRKNKKYRDREGDE